MLNLKYRLFTGSLFTIYVYHIYYLNFKRRKSVSKYCSFGYFPYICKWYSVGSKE